ncbi:TetR/AcrR family transcriptional regulator [Granulosicoccus antarcticus]|uniref:Putative HTH-type transcriptional regulator n=1 Tax=Granulosicoccus antarcticus IMCC3135 TaxID=1192854 RepID=A0A2Z2NS91_9GAMM|nr:TetR/AcrR family transcriptional regulator [Granulosicoccus antarcticus]ASJ72871.1 putative HTH-type transcriptional regulator [Granulosicoccus antarcticus IMCC3135]
MSYEKHPATVTVSTGKDAVRRTQTERSAETIDALRHATIALMTEVGFVNMTTTSIAERAGVSRGAMLHHFGNKVALVKYATGEMWNGVVISTDALRAQCDPYKPDPKMFVDALWNGAMAATHVSVTADITLAARGNPELKAHLDSWVSRMFKSYNATGRHAFGKTGLSNKECDALIATIASTLRGQRVAQMFSPSPATDVAVRAMLTQLLTDRLERAAP